MARTIGMATFALMTVAALFSLSGLTSNAEYGLSSIVFYAIPAVIFFIPIMLVSAMLATGWSTGGIFTWVSAAFGKRWGFLAIWLQWFQSLTLYMTILSFAAATIAFAFDPALAENDFFVFGAILAVYWGSTLLNLRGMRLSSAVSSAGAVLGTILPGLVLMALAALWISAGNPPEASFAPEALIPNLESLNDVALMLGGVVLFAGIEMTAVHINEVKSPERNYPRAIFLAAGIALVMFIFGSLAIAALVPKAEISLVAGVMEAYSSATSSLGIPWLLPVAMLFIAGGSLAQLITWIGGPSKGLLRAARAGCLPPAFQKENRHGMPSTILLLQGAIVTVLSFLFVMLPDVSDSFWILTALTAQIYLTMYMMMFASAVKLRYSQPKVKPKFRIPGGAIGLWAVAGTGTLAALAGIALGYLPPGTEKGVGAEFYAAFLALGLAVVIAMPLAIFHFRKKDWAKAGG